MTMANIKRLHAVLDHITEHPEEHRQQSWRTEKEGCGTRMCFAGHTVVMFGPQAGMTGWAEPVFENRLEGKMYGSVVVDNVEVDVETFAADLLGLDHDQQQALFYSMGGVIELREVVLDIEHGLIGEEV